LLDCIILLVERIKKGNDAHANLLLGKREEGAGSGRTAGKFYQGAVQESITARKARAEENVAGKIAAQASVSLNGIDEGACSSMSSQMISYVTYGQVAWGGDNGTSFIASIGNAHSCSQLPQIL
jgi:hypothetical protein